MKKKSPTVPNDLCLFFFVISFISHPALGLVFAPAISGAGAGGQHNFSNPFLQNAYIASV